jgi:hypothetical protein
MRGLGKMQLGRGAGMGLLPTLLRQVRAIRGFVLAKFTKSQYGHKALLHSLRDLIFTVFHQRLFLTQNFLIILGENSTEADKKQFHSQKFQLRRIK